jgi:GNAT superfamily N-acetyltransferase
MPVMPARERPLALDTLVAAFAADPLFAWAFPTGDAAAMRWFHTLLLGPASQHGEIQVPTDGGATGGLAAFVPPGRPWSAFAIRDFVRHGGARVPVRHLPRLLQCTRFIRPLAAAHPREPHYHLQILAVHPRAQGRGLGNVLLGAVTARADADRAPVYLETTNPANLAYYRRHGFAQTSELRIGPMPPLWTMVRPRA